MDTQAPTKAPAAVAPSYAPEPEPASGRSPAFIVFAVLFIGASAVGGAVKSGKLDLNKYFHAAKSAAQAKPVTEAKAPPAPAVPLKPGAFVVTSISLGQPSIAIINGVSHGEGDPIEAPGVTGWKVKRIGEDAVWLQNGATVATVPLTLPGLKPLDDQLHPLN